MALPRLDSLAVPLVDNSVACPTRRGRGARLRAWLLRGICCGAVASHSADRPSVSKPSKDAAAPPANSPAAAAAGPLQQCWSSDDVGCDRSSAPPPTGLRPLAPLAASDDGSSSDEFDDEAVTPAMTTGDAIAFLAAVKRRFGGGASGGGPPQYEALLETLRQLRANQLDTAGVVARVQRLFRGHRDLILGFNAFLPKEYEIQQTSEDEAATEDDVPPVRADAVVKANAVGYVHEVKMRFQNDERMYRAFLGVLKRHQAGALSADGVRAAVALLFRGHPGLLAGFDAFLPRGRAGGGGGDRDSGGDDSDGDGGGGGGGGGGDAERDSPPPLPPPPPLVRPPGASAGPRLGAPSSGGGGGCGGGGGDVAAEEGGGGGGLSEAGGGLAWASGRANAASPGAPWLTRAAAAWPGGSGGCCGGVGGGGEEGDKGGALWDTFPAHRQPVDVFV